MAKKGPADKWLCQVYNSKNGGFKSDDWDNFDEFCEENDMADEFLIKKKKQPVKKEKYTEEDQWWMIWN